MLKEQISKKTRDYRTLPRTPEEAPLSHEKSFALDENIRKPNFVDNSF